MSSFNIQGSTIMQHRIFIFPSIMLSIFEHVWSDFLPLPFSFSVLPLVIEGGFVIKDHHRSNHRTEKVTYRFVKC